MPDSYSFLVPALFFFFSFLSSVSCHFLGYQFVLSHFQFAASNLLSAPGKPNNWASANCVQVTEWPSGLCGACYTYLSFSSILLPGSTTNTYNWRTRKFWTGSIFPYYEQIKGDNNLSVTCWSDNVWNTVFS